MEQVTINITEEVEEVQVNVFEDTVFSKLGGSASDNPSLVAFVTALLAGKILLKTSAQWTADNTILIAGQLGIATDTGIIKLGDGGTAWNALANAVTFAKLGGSASENASLVAYVKRPRTVILAANFTTTSLTAVNVTGLNMSVEAGKSYFVQIFVCTSTASGTGRIGYTLPAGTIRMAIRANTTDGIARYFNHDAGTSGYAPTTSSNPGFAEIIGTITPSASGDIQIQAIAVSGTWSVVTGSFIRVTEI